MVKAISEFEKLSDNISDAVRHTLNLPESVIIFSGNEEKIWLYALFQKLSAFENSPQVEIEIECFPTTFKFLDIYSFGQRERSKKRATISEIPNSIRSLLIAMRNWINKGKERYFVEKKLQSRENIFHYAASLRRQRDVCPNLTDHFCVAQAAIKKDKGMRVRFLEYLLAEGLSKNIATFVAELFPTSHLELFEYFSTHKVNGYSPQRVITSIYGIMGDPLISFLVKNSKADLIYVQHGGGYGLNQPHTAHRLEAEGADEMYFWGTGNKNVYPTRYRENFFARLNKNIFIVFSLKDLEKIERVLKTVRPISQANAQPVTAALHPDSPFIDLGVKTLHGLTYRQNEGARLVVFDDVMHSLMFARILTRRPFLVLDSPINDDRAGSAAAKHFLELMRDCRILVSESDMASEFARWSALPKEESVERFREQAKPFLDLVLTQPKLYDLIDNV